METSENREIRNTHKWNAKTNECIHCGCFREKTTHPNNPNWTHYIYYDKETGEESRKVTCKTNQYVLL